MPRNLVKKSLKCEGASGLSWLVTTRGLTAPPILPAMPEVKEFRLDLSFCSSSGPRLWRGSTWEAVFAGSKMGILDVVGFLGECGEGFEEV